MEVSLLVLTVISLGWYKLNLCGATGGEINMMTAIRMMMAAIALRVLRFVALSNIFIVCQYFFLKCVKDQRIVYHKE